MLYLVQFEYVEPGPMYPPDQVTKMVDRTIVPSLEMVARYQEEGKILAAGVYAGSKGSAMILDVADHDELSQLLQSLPFWSIMRVRITPMQPFAQRHEQERRAVQFLQSEQARFMQDAW